MKKLGNNTWMLLLLLMFVTFYKMSAQDEKEIKAEIKIFQEDNFINIFPTAINQTYLFQENLHYSFLLLKKTKSGNLSKNTQSGFFSLSPNESITLSNSKLSIEPETQFQMFLFIKKDSLIVAKDTLSIGDKSFKVIENKKAKTEAQHGLELSGLILDNVISQAGRLFVEKFNNYYRMNQYNFPFAVIIDEKPMMGGRNSEIKISVNDEIIDQFSINMDEELIDAYVKLAYRKLAAHYQTSVKMLQQERLY